MNFVENQSTIMSAMSPLGSDFCDYFYYLTMINLILLVYVILVALYIFIFEKKKDSLFHVILSFLPIFMGYFTNRLLYSMCVGSTQKM
jgi:hypothetical protein